MPRQARRSLRSARADAGVHGPVMSFAARRALLANATSPPLNLTVSGSEAAQPPDFLAPDAEGATRVCEVPGTFAQT